MYEDVIGNSILAIQRFKDAKKFPQIKYLFNPERWFKRGEKLLIHTKGSHHKLQN